jgi:pimeloyl-ACP methyl ester carboxylesterase
MESARIGNLKLDYEVKGTGEPVLLVSPVLADGFLPLFSEPALAEYQLVRYHRRGWAGSTHLPPSASIADHAADAAALLAHLGVRRAHIAGHSSGGTICLQLALEHPELVHTVALLEPSLLTVPGAQPFLEKAGPALEAYRVGDSAKAVAIFLSAASGLEWETCRTVIEQHAPGAVAQAIKDADTFFGIELPSLGAYAFGPEQGAAIVQPALSVLGARTERLWLDVASLLRASLPNLEERTIEGVGHLLHLQSPRPVAQTLAEFLARHPIASRSETAGVSLAV